MQKAIDPGFSDSTLRACSEHSAEFFDPESSDITQVDDKSSEFELERGVEYSRKRERGFEKSKKRMTCVKEL